MPRLQMYKSDSVMGWISSLTSFVCTGQVIIRISPFTINNTRRIFSIPSWQTLLKNVQIENFKKRIYERLLTFLSLKSSNRKIMAHRQHNHIDPAVHHVRSYLNQVFYPADVDWTRPQAPDSRAAWEPATSGSGPEPVLGFPHPAAKFSTF